MLDLRLYMLQRLSALIMAPLVLGHLALMIWAVQGGLSAAEILGRTQGSALWFAYYELFVVAAAVHSAIGIRVVAHEWAGLGGGRLRVLMWGTMLALGLLGTEAVLAVTLT